MNETAGVYVPKPVGSAVPGMRSYIVNVRIWIYVQLSVNIFMFVFT